MSIALFATLSPLPEHREVVLQALEALVQGTRNEPGNLRYDLYAGEDGSLQLHELYRNQAAIDAHRASPHYLAFREAAVAGGWMAAPTHVVQAVPVNVAQG